MFLSCLVGYNLAALELILWATTGIRRLTFFPTPWLHDTAEPHMRMSAIPDHCAPHPVERFHRPIPWINDCTACSAWCNENVVSMAVHALKEPPTGYGFGYLCT